MNHISIIIPFFRGASQEALEETLVSVLENRPPCSEILVVLGENYTDPWEVRKEGVRFLSISRRISPTQIINEGIEHARGAVLNIVLPGTCVESGWTEDAVRAFGNSAVAVVVPTIYEQSSSQEPQIRNCVYRIGGKISTVVSKTPFDREKTNLDSDSFTVPLPNAAFFRKSALEEINLLKSSFFPQIAYIDVCLMLRHLGMKIECVNTSSAIIRENCMFQDETFAWNLQCEQLYLRWANLGGWFCSVQRHITCVLSEVLSHLPHLSTLSVLCGRLLGWGHYGAHRMQTAQIQRHLQEKQHSVLLLNTSPLSLENHDTNWNFQAGPPKSSKSAA